MNPENQNTNKDEPAPTLIQPTVAKTDEFHPAPTLPASHTHSKVHDFIAILFIANVCTIYVPWACFGLILIASSLGDESAQYFTLMLILPMLAGLIVAVTNLIAYPIIKLKYSPTGRDNLLITLSFLTTFAFAAIYIFSITFTE